MEIVWVPLTIFGGPMSPRGSLKIPLILRGLPYFAFSECPECPGFHEITVMRIKFGILLLECGRTKFKWVGRSEII